MTLSTPEEKDPDIIGEEWGETHEEDLEDKCHLCKLSTFNTEKIELGVWVYHPDCYQIALQRLDSFMRLIHLPQAEFDEWLADDSQ